MSATATFLRDVAPRWNCVSEFREEGGALVPYCNVGGVLRPVAWAALPGSQAAFLADRGTKIVLFQGGRGATGKSECLTVDAIQDIGQGMGSEYRALMIRRTFPELEDIKAVGAKIIPKIWPGASYNATSSTWTFPDGATLAYRPLLDMSEMEWNRFHGRSVSWVGIDELATFPTLEPLQALLSILRSTHPLAKPRLRAATNTWGDGRDAILEYFQLSPAAAPMIGPLVTGGDAPPRRVISGNIFENWPLMIQQPEYLDQIRASCKGNPAKLDAWLHGIWAAPPGMYFGDVNWSHVIVPDFEPPTPGTIRLGFDHGFSEPSAGVFCWESRGEDITFPDGSKRATRKGDVFVVDEFYGASRPNVGLKLPPSEIAKRLFAIIERHVWNRKILNAVGNVSDTSIFSPSMVEHRASIAEDLRQCGIVFEGADKARELGALEMLKRLMAATPPADAPREDAALYVCEGCTNLIRTLPNLKRDPVHIEDVDSDSPDDHLYDALRYWLRRERVPPVSFRRRYHM